MRLTVVGAMIAAVTLLAACGDNPSPQVAAPAASASVRTAHAERVAVSGDVRAVGILGPRDELRLSFKTGGVVERVAVDVGDRVAAGQLQAALARATRTPQLLLAVLCCLSCCLACRRWRGLEKDH